MHQHLADCLADDPIAIMIEEEAEGVNVTSFKIWMIVVFFIICLAGLAPKACDACTKSETALSFLNCFSAGIFLGMALIHMMPEGAALYASWAKQAGYADIVLIFVGDICRSSSLVALFIRGTRRQSAAPGVVWSSIFFYLRAYFIPALRIVSCVEL